MNPPDAAVLLERQQKLYRVRDEMKAFFIGIDSVIDELFESIRVWYVLPELLSRPVIVCLWGMTGVGKTDLVRRMVRGLEFQDRFCEIELSNGDSTQYFSSVSTILQRQGLNDEKPSVVLFDEIQRFNTLDENQVPLTNTKFTDFWELLSDGRLARRDREDLDFQLSNLMYSAAENRRARQKDTSVEVGRLGIWEAQSLKRNFNLEGEVDDIANRTYEELMATVQNQRKKKTIFEPVSYAKSLFVIGGNLDDAFTMASMSDDADLDADIFHAFTQKVTVINVKQSLARRFKPEQVARFGNVHLIYPSLKKAEFMQLIGREVERVKAGILKMTGVTVSIDDSVSHHIYRNGVFPAQGVRPVFSSVADILESNLVFFTLEAVFAGVKSFTLKYAIEAESLVADLGGKEYSKKCPGRLDAIRKQRLEDVVVNVATHEAGHAVAYAALFGLAPLQLTCKVTSNQAAGFTFPHDILETRGSILKKIQVFLAGGLAEELFFGSENASVGRWSDRERATILASDFIRRHGFDDEFQSVYSLEHGYAMDKFATDVDIEKMMARLVAETRQLLSKHLTLIRTLAEQLHRDGSIDSETVARLCQAHGVAAVVKPEGHQHVSSYKTLLSSKQ